MAGDLSIIGPLLGLFAGLIIFVIVLLLALYVYWALAFMTIARKLKYDKPWLAWIPIANFFLLPILAKKKWTWGFMFFVPIAGFVFMIIWTWKIYERRNYPGALSLIYLGTLIPIVNWFAGIANLVVLGLVAWYDMK
jgi:hypothetical protein